MADPDSYTAPNSELLNRVKDEISFFMEKTFQISFGYLGAVIALSAASSLDASAAVSRELGVGTASLFCAALLILNAVYLSLASGTLFATIKRGLFLIIQDPRSTGHRRWEGFVRGSDDASPFGKGRRAFLTWNLDNFYMTPLFVLIGLISIAAAVVGLKEADDSLARAVVMVTMAAHALPAGMLVATGKLAGHAAHMARSTHEDPAGEQQRIALGAKRGSS